MKKLNLKATSTGSKEIELCFVGHKESLEVFALGGLMNATC